MDLPPEVVVLVFSYLTLNDIIDASAACELFYNISRRNELFVRNLDDSLKLFTWIGKYSFNYQCMKFFDVFSVRLFVSLKKYVKEDCLSRVKNIVMDRLYYSVLPFRVWNHLFLCERFNSLDSMCKYCTKCSVEIKKISWYINDNLFVHISDIPHQLKHGFSLFDKVPLFVHTNVMKSEKCNLGGVYYDKISSPFLLWKFYLNIISRIVFNFSYKFIYIQLVPCCLNVNCRDFTACATQDCPNKKKLRVKAIFLRNW